MAATVDRDGDTGAKAGIKTIHVIFKTHLDIGFTALARNVVDRYFTSYIPRAISLARTLREAGGTERFVWTTGSWLIYEYLERASPQERARIDDAVAAGDIAWHGIPFTTHTELIDPSLYRYGLGLSRDLDRRYGKRTIAAKMTDVTGHTRGLVPLLEEAGLRFLHIGVNPACRAPDVPPVFVWRDPSGAEVMVMYHKGAYGDLMIVPGLEDAILFAHTGDNLGPQPPEEVIALYARLRAEFPGTSVVASTMDRFAAALERIRPALPVVADEIADTWIYGVGSDPGKVARYRELSRLRRAWLDAGAIAPGDPALGRFSRNLLLVAEHTWGLDEKTHLADYTHYAGADFLAVRDTERFRHFASAWEEQRAYLDQAVAALDDAPLAREAEERQAALRPVAPDLEAYTPVADPAAPIEMTHFSLRFGPTHGDLIGFVERGTGRAWATVAHSLGLFRYETLSHDDYLRYWRHYVINKRQVRVWAWPDIAKPGMEKTGVEHQTWLPALAGLYRRADEHGEHILADVEMPVECVTLYGAPRRVTMEWTFPHAEPVAHLTVQWFEKQACRLPEAIWLSFAPLITDVRGWRLDKMGAWISPLEVIRDGNRKLHAVETGVEYRDADGGLRLLTLDAPLVAPGERTLMKSDNRQPPLREGMHINLLNNVYGTNFRMWYDEDARFRFILQPCNGRVERRRNGPIEV